MTTTTRTVDELLDQIITEGEADVETAMRSRSYGHADAANFADLTRLAGNVRRARHEEPEDLQRQRILAEVVIGRAMTYRNTAESRSHEEFSVYNAHRFGQLRSLAQQVLQLLTA